MTKEGEIRERIRQICQRDRRYAFEAYLFVQAAVGYTQEQISRENPEGQVRHVDGRQLLAGVRDLAIDEFGPIAKTVLNDWGIQSTRDVGDVVFNLVSAHLLGARESDSIADFEGVYDFDDVFVAPFIPRGITPIPPTIS